MKNFIILLLTGILILGLNTGVKAQKGDLIVFSEKGGPFTLVLNSEVQNSEPATNVKVQGLTAPYYKAKIIFENMQLNTIEKNLYIKYDYAVTYRIKEKSNGQKVLRFYSEALLASEYNEEYSDIDETGNVHTKVNVYTDAHETTDGFNMDVTADDNSASVHINVNGESVGVEVHADGDITEAEYNEYHAESEVHTDDMPTPEEAYQGDTGCRMPMTQHEFTNAKQSVISKDFASDKMIIAKQIISANCMTVNQIKQIISLFDFESDKLEFAKYAYSYTFDIKNYYIINDVFDFSSSVEELDRYINSLH